MANSSTFEYFTPSEGSSLLDGNLTTDVTVPAAAPRRGCAFSMMPNPAPADYVLFRFLIDVCVVGILCLVGFIGNALCIMVLHRDCGKDKKNTTNWLLQTLAMADTLYLITCIFFQTLKGINDWTDWWPALKLAMPYMEPYIWAFASIAQTITVWLVILVTVDRYVAICKPLKTQLRTIQRAKMAVAVVVILAIFYNIPRFLERKIVYNYDEATNTTIVKTVRTPLRNNRVYFLVYKTVMYFCFRSIGPLLLLIFLNFRLIRALQEVRRKHRDMTKSNRHRENITLVLVVVVSIFIICEVPDTMVRLVVTMCEFIPIISLNLLTVRYVNCLTNMMMTVNSSINFLIYCLIGQKFRKIFRQMCCKSSGTSVIEASESEPLTTRTAVVPAKNGAVSRKTGQDVQLWNHQHRNGNRWPHSTSNKIMQNCATVRWDILMHYFEIWQPGWQHLSNFKAINTDLASLRFCQIFWFDFNSLRPRLNGRLFADDTFKRIFANENARIFIEISL